MATFPRGIPAAGAGGSIASFTFGDGSDPAISPRDVELLPFKGIAQDKPSTRLVEGDAWMVENLYWWDNAYHTRAGTIALGTLLPSPICTVLKYSNATSVGEYPFACMTSGFAYFVGGSWVLTIGPTLTATSDTQYSTTQWGDTIVYANGVDIIGSVDLNAVTHDVLDALAPIASYVVAWGGRIWATGILGQPGRVQWSVKNDNTDWVGQGSGFEDLLAAPGGLVDDAYQIIPINETSAILIRRYSIWLLTLTGYVDAPVQFSRLYTTNGSDSPFSFVRTPIGIIGLFTSGMMVFDDQNQPSPIGQAVFNPMFDNINTFLTCGCYDSWKREYRCLVPSATYLGYSDVWRYNIRDQRWTLDRYPYIVQSIASSVFRDVTVVDQVQDIVDTIHVIVDDFDNSNSTTYGLLIAQYGPIGRLVAREFYGQLTDITYGDPLTTQPIAVMIESGDFVPGTAIRRAQMIELQAEYTIAATQDALVEYSDDGGLSWQTYDLQTLSVAYQTQITRWTRSLLRERLRVRLTLDDSSDIVISSLIGRVLPGSKHAY